MSHSRILAIGAAASLSLLAGAVHAQGITGLVNGTRTTIPSTSSINLTTQGTTDWENFAYGGAPVADEKSGGAGIGAFTFTKPTVDPTMYPNANTNVFGNYPGGDQPERTWTDGGTTNTIGNGGTNTNPVTGTPYNGNGSRYGQSGIDYTSSYGDGSGVGSSYSFNVVATAAPQVFTLYVGASHDTGVMTAALTGGTGVSYSDTVVTTSGPFVTYAYAFTFSSLTPGATLNVNWMETARNGAYDTQGIEAATLAPFVPVAATPEPSSVASLALGVLGLGGLALVARRRTAQQAS